MSLLCLVWADQLQEPGWLVTECILMSDVLLSFSIGLKLDEEIYFFMDCWLLCATLLSYSSP